MSSPSRPRVLVVGAGHNGLVAAITLAAAGCDVTVLEASDRPGGAVRTEPGPLPGFIHDRCAGFFPLTVASPAFEGLDIASGSTGSHRRSRWRPARAARGGHTSNHSC